MYGSTLWYNRYLDKIDSQKNCKHSDAVPTHKTNHAVGKNKQFYRCHSCGCVFFKII